MYTSLSVTPFGVNYDKIHKSQLKYEIRLRFGGFPPTLCDL